MSFLSSRTRSARQGFGKPVPRREDARLLTGQGRFSDDFSLPGQAHAALVRSPHAHARIRQIDVAAALAVPGVVTVLTGEDAAADNLRPIPHRPVPTNPHEVPLGGRDGSEVFIAPHPPMPADRARFAGEAVAMVIAETGAAARDGAERVAVEWEPLPAVTATADAAAPDAPRVWDETGSNVCVDSGAGDAAAADAAFARAAHVARLETWVQRVTGVPMEPRAALGAYDETSGRYTLYAGSGGVVRHQSDLAAILGVPETAVRVVSGEVGGNFGTRNSFYPEFALVAWAAKRLFTTEISEVPSTSNPLGLRGGGEGGTTPALGAVINAVVDALAELGVEHLEMPATPERVWRAIQAARARATGGPSPSFAMIDATRCRTALSFGSDFVIAGFTLWRVGHRRGSR